MTNTNSIFFQNLFLVHHLVAILVATITNISYLVFGY